MERNKIKIFHFCLSSPVGNFGDDVLFLATKDAFKEIFRGYEIKWVNYPLRNHATDNVIKKANSCDLILVGGGGLLLKDTNPNQYSGWQWACSVEHLKAIKKPLVIYSIGYNRFRNQEEFDDIFFEHIKLTIDKAAFFSVRNTGSKKALIKYNIPQDKIIVNPCPSLFYKQKTTKNYKQNKIIKIGINLAGDRSDLRFNDQDSFYRRFSKVLQTVTDKGYELCFFNHSWNPQSNCQDFINSLSCSKKIYNIETVWNRKDIDRAISLYKSMDLIIAMRGHSQMIPFGQHKMVISLISHDKLKWFLEDVSMENTGVDVNDKDLFEKLTSLIYSLINSEDYFIKQDKALKKLMKVYLENSQKIRRIIL